MYYMTKRNLLTTIGMLAVVSAFAQKEYPSRAPMTPAMSEYWTHRYSGKSTGRSNRCTV